MKDLKQLKSDYEAACNAYVDAFCKKQELEFDGWAGDTVGGIASFISQYFFDMHDIALDIDNKIPKGEILNWQDEAVEAHSDGKVGINYRSYIMGLRQKDLK